MAKTTFIINDGDRVSVHTGDTSNLEDVLDMAGYTLGEQDRVVSLDSDGISQITIYRTQDIDLFYCGQHIPITSEGETVGELLSRMGISLTEDTSVSVDLNEYTYDGMTVIINKDVSQLETYSRTLSFKTSYVEDPSLPLGEESVIAEGSNGEEVVSAMVYYHNGQEVSRVIQSQTVTKEPEDRVIAIGVEAEDQISVPLVETSDSSGGTIHLPSGEVLTFTDKIDVMGTAYTCEGWDNQGITATGTVARVGEIAVDPSLIPLGTRVFVRSTDGEYIYGIATAEDTGGLIKGHRIDLYMDSEWECVQFGYRLCEVFILG